MKNYYRKILLFILVFSIFFSFGCSNSITTSFTTDSTETSASSIDTVNDPTDTSTESVTTSIGPQECSHEWQYGYCSKCGELSEIAINDLQDHIKAWFAVFVVANYSSAFRGAEGDEKLGDCLSISLQEINTNGSTYTVNGEAIVTIKGKDCISTFQYVGDWTEDTEDGEKIHFLYKDINFSEPTNLEISPWEIVESVDEFGDPTGISSIVGVFYGTFSNVATSSSDLKVFVYFFEDYIVFVLNEYGSYHATFTNADTITLKIKTDAGTKQTYTLLHSAQFLFCSDSSFVTAIKENRNLSCYITVSSKYHSVPDTYEFTLNNIGLSELLMSELLK